MVLVGLYSTMDLIQVESPKFDVIMTEKQKNNNSPPVFFLIASKWFVNP
jgi:hypothetical protein